MTTLTEGKKAPVFKGVDQNGEKISLTDFKGKKVILYFYPKDDTPGVSADPVKSHKKFETKYKLPFPLIADEDKKIAEQYGVWGEKKFMGKTYMGITRTTFLIGEEGKIKKIINKPDTKNHTEEILNAWNEIG